MNMLPPKVATEVWVDKVTENKASVTWIKCSNCESREEDYYNYAKVDLNLIEIAEAGDCPYVSKIEEKEAELKGIPTKYCCG